MFRGISAPCNMFTKGDTRNYPEATNGNSFLCLDKMPGLGACCVPPNELILQEKVQASILDCLAAGMLPARLTHCCGSTYLVPGGGKMKNLALRLWRDEAGQDLTEYALLMVLIALASIVAMKNLAGAISNVYSNAASNLSSQT